MPDETDRLVRKGLLARQQELQKAMETASRDPHLQDLFQEVTAALDRLDHGTYGICEICHDSIEVDRLLVDPTIRVCLDHQNPEQMRALETDLSLAAQIQKGLLPRQDLSYSGWETAYHYQAAGIVSGDYCDLFCWDDCLYFVVGDVSGKGISAAMLMSHLQATFRSLVTGQSALDEIMARANRMFCESTLPNHFATLAFGRATPSGDVQLCSAGHPPVLIEHTGEIERVEATGLPLGLFCNETFSLVTQHVDPGDRIVLYTDGLTEATDSTGEEYGSERLVGRLRVTANQSAQATIADYLADRLSFRPRTTLMDDLTLLVLRKLP